ncbi:anti-sigma factor [Bacteroidia bacterium]|nr:anti-sigma factor [Bacteroidia bacterium]
MIDHDKYNVEKNRISDIELNSLFKRIEVDTVIRLRKRRKIFLYSAAASILLVLAGSFYFSLLKQNQEDLIVFANSQNPKINPEYVELILPDDERVTIVGEDASIDHGQEGVIKINEKAIDKTQENTKTVKKGKKEKEFNTLTVPYGKRSSLTLEDGTHIWVNAGTFLVYPVTFDDDKREIYVDGEIYMDVAKEPNRPFHVKTSDMQVVVLGTSFNVTAYKSDNVSSVVLVNGSVQVRSKDNKKPYMLKPNDMFSKQDNRVNIKQVKASEFISWVNGMYICDNENLESILLRLSRYYNIKISIDKDASGLLCSGKLDLKEDIRDVLNVLSSTAPVTYEIDKKEEYHFMSKQSK